MIEGGEDRPRSVQTQPDKARSVQALIDQLWLEGRTRSIERVAIVEVTVAALLLGEPDDRIEARSAAHKLAGTLGMFGLPGGSDTARQIEEALERPELDDDELVSLSDLVVGLRASIESGPDRPAAAPPVSSRPALHLVGGDRSYVEAMTFGMESRGFDVRFHDHRLEPGSHDGPEWAGAVAVVVDCATVTPDGIPGTSGRGDDVVMVAIGTPPDSEVRVALVERAVDLIIGDDVGPDRAVQLVADEVERRRHRARVHLIGPPLGGPEISFTGLSPSPVSIRDLFTMSYRPGDLLVIDARALATRSALRWCQMIRASAETRWLPLVVVLKPRAASRTIIGQLLAAGADDVTVATGSELTGRLQALGIRHQRCRPSVEQSVTDSTVPDATIEIGYAPVRTAPRDEDPLERGDGDPERLDPSILVVDDDPLIGRLVSQLLTSRGHRVEVVSDGPGAAALLSRPQAIDEYKLVVLDVSLPGLDGFGVLRQLRESSSSAQVPVVLLTARASEAEVLAGLDLGAVDHVAKPFSPLVLLSRLERALGP